LKSYHTRYRNARRAPVGVHIGIPHREGY
jgi:hypothetical protein